MPTQETNTAADRLLRIMRDVAASRNDTMVKVWARALELKSSDKLEVFRGILSLAALVDEIEMEAATARCRRRLTLKY
jgi:hypothetical protein